MGCTMPCRAASSRNSTDTRWTGQSTQACIGNDSWLDPRMNRFKKRYTPWRKNLWLIGGGLFLATLLAATAVRTGSLSTGSVMLMILYVGAAYYGWTDYGRRAYGKELEEKAQRDLVKACEGSDFTTSLNVRCTSGGDIDAVVTGYRWRFAIEIKSWAGVRTRGDKLVKMNGSPLHGDPVEQCLRQASSLQAIAVLWIPANRGRSRVFVHRGVLVANTTAKGLVYAMSTKDKN